MTPTAGIVLVDITKAVKSRCASWGYKRVVGRWYTEEDGHERQRS